jgi:hypothetical protein
MLLCPRLAVMYASRFFPASAWPKTKDCGFISVILWPDFYLFNNSCLIGGGLPATLRFGMILKLLMRIGFAAHSAFNFGHVGVLLFIAWDFIVKPLLFGLLHTLCMLLIWPITPSILSDALVHLVVWFGFLIPL